jgi:hypothetical protein
VVSKVDAQRALRDARFAAYRAKRAADGDPVTEPAPVVVPARPAKAEPAAAAPKPVKAAEPAAASEAAAAVAAAPDAAAPEAAEELCGHRNIGGKSCRRPAGHSEKNHRYS